MLHVRQAVCIGEDHEWDLVDQKGQRVVITGDVDEQLEVWLMESGI